MVFPFANGEASASQRISNHYASPTFGPLCGKINIYGTVSTQLPTNTLISDLFLWRRISPISHVAADRIRDIVEATKSNFHEHEWNHSPCRGKMARRLLIDRQLPINHPRSMESEFVDINQPTFLLFTGERERERLLVRARKRNLSGWRDEKGSNIETVISSIVYAFSYPSNDVIQYREREKKREISIDLFEEREESGRDLSKPRWIRISRGRVCPSPNEKRKRDMVDITVATTISSSLPYLLLSVNCRFTRIRSFGPIHERKRVHPRLVCRE